MSKKVTKKDIKRLELMLSSLVRFEARLQQDYGDAIKGTVRCSSIRDAESLRAVLTFIKAQA